MNLTFRNKSNFFQKTINKPISFSGISLHKALNSTINIKPGEEDTGILFCRTDLRTNNYIKANYKNVRNTNLCTVISNNFGCKVSTIEHLMAAFYGLGIDNALVEINCEEMPALDGSAISYVNSINDVGIKNLKKLKNTVKIKKQIFISENDKMISIEPSENFEIEMNIDHNDQIIGKQFFNFIFNENSFEKEISKARTYGFLKDAQKLFQNGLAIGASTENALIFDNNKIINKDGLRYDDEPVRHKILDCIGDLFLCGYWVQGKIKAYKSGHKMNSKLLYSIFASPENCELIEYKEIFSNESHENFKISAIA